VTSHGLRSAPHAQAIEHVLPQTQCTQCGFAGCRPYAQAIAEGTANINRCVPGGRAVIAQLAELTGLPMQPLDPQCGTEQPRQLAWIDPSACIGCTKCIQACPVDAIIGASKWLHAVVPALCTGCRLCLAPCPVDCIQMQDLPQPAPWSAADAQAARARFEARGHRLHRNRRRQDERLAAKALAKLQSLPDAADPGGRADPSPSVDASAEQIERKRAIIEAAIERARARLQS
jgi:Na+-translocating ferredoxin:NAD+ oxidoreductase subunit B